LFATRQIEKNSVIFREKPFVIYSEADMQRLFNHPDLVSDPEYVALWKIVNQDAAKNGSEEHEAEARRAMDAVVERQMSIVYTESPKAIQEKWMALQDSLRVKFKTPSGVWRSNAYENPIHGLYETRCRMNHSCDPNTEEGDGLACAVIRATRDIAPGEELFCSYLEEDGLEIDKRQTELRWRYRFDCRCSKCQQEARDLLAQIQAMSTAKAADKAKA
jgi:hypothetical protein